MPELIEPLIHSNLVLYTCDKCNKGYMKATGAEYESLPVQYEHRCTQCDAHGIYLKRYPYMVEK